MILHSCVMKEYKMAQTVANTHFCCGYVKTTAQVIEIYHICMEIKHLFNILGSLGDSYGLSY